jgi:hypothetical protein
MGLSLMSAMMIQRNETLVDTYSNNKKTKYGFIVYLIKGKEIHTEIVSTLPHYPYPTQGIAKIAGDALVKTVRDMDLSPETNKLEKAMGCPEISKAVSEIVKKANE